MADEMKYAQAKESDRLADPEVCQKRERVRDIITFVKPAWYDFDCDYHEPGAFLDHQANTFYFFPSTALILLKSLPLRSYQFPRGSTLPQIHEGLAHRYNRENEDDPVFQTLEVLHLRECFGIQVPDHAHDEVIKIGLPDPDSVSDMGDEIPVAAWAAFDVNGEANLESWQCWFDLFQPSNGPTRQDAARLFDDWSWGVGPSSEARQSSQVSPCTRPRIQHVVPSDTNRTPCIRGGIGGDPDERHGTIRAEPGAQCCNDKAGHTYPKLSSENLSAHWLREHVSADTGSMKVLEKFPMYPGKRHLVAKQLSTDHACVRCGIPNPRIYRLARESRLQDMGTRGTATPMYERDVWWKERGHCLKNAEGDA
ncbi:uncharacterized protein M421DRAFT_10207 [Didymella exigua CBS 183.55]|uniref:Uncharacterized protein n=1 Tax=Didymella exigua CBS 183.55 TaxID=1150837 RepID=A0A6A5R444_9PLEO|nr:uncharacterized protein M421DRAFT_10207 [Didymella exigua CBS 183.55]KAF1922855.1 hypothetical protein M421DRAFT_10207 [Didymella exigua CBS 183.55]